MSDSNVSYHFYPQSLVQDDGVAYYLLKSTDGIKYLGIKGNFEGFAPCSQMDMENVICPINVSSANTLRQRLPWLNPSPLGLKSSIGTGDRLGLATPGHVRAVTNKSISPVFAQQSVRENTRTGRTPQQVLDDAMWGIFQEGWRDLWGADADHIKEINQVQPFLDAGYTFFTADPGEYVNLSAHTLSGPDLLIQYQDLPWDSLGISPDTLLLMYQDQSYALGSTTLTFDQDILERTAIKYGKALAHVAALYHYIASHRGGKPFDFEVSVDETDLPTSPHEHFFITRELHRLGVQFDSLAPRFVGSFEKGVDFIGSLQQLSDEMRNHAAVVNHFGTYKISLHSGSDKFSVYPLLNQYSQGHFHVKTAGTSYLEALRVIAQLSPGFFRDIVTASLERYPTDRASYHVSAEINNVPTISNLMNSELPYLLDQFDVRQILHVCFGSILDRYGEDLHFLLAASEEQYYDALQIHFEHHLTALNIT